MKKSLLVVLAIIILSSNSIIAQFAGGSGTIEDPYQISNATELDSVRNHLEDHFILINDIDLNISPYNTGIGWEPIGDWYNTHFAGSIDGNGYTITGLHINNIELYDVGLFGSIRKLNEFIPVIKNIVLEQVNIIGKNYVGGLAGVVQESQITNSHINSGIVIGDDFNIGGLVGELRSGLISGSSSSANVSGERSVGGLVGFNRGQIVSSYSVGEIIIDFEDASISNIGGLIGQHSFPADSVGISNSYSASPIQLLNSSSEQIDFDGLGIGGLVGNASPDDSVKSSYWSRLISNVERSALGLNLSLSEMLQKESYVGWDFDSVWDIDQGGSFPFLRNNQISEPPKYQNRTYKVPDDYSTIQEAINMVFDGDTIIVDAGTYNENVIFNGKNIVLASKYLTTGEEFYIESTIIDGGSNGSVVSIVNGEDSSTELFGFTLQNGSNFTAGGGILIMDSEPKLRHLIIRNNESINGHAIYTNTNIIVEHCLIENNGSQNNSGFTIYSDSGFLLSNSIIHNNRSSKDISVFGSGDLVIEKSFLKGRIPVAGTNAHLKTFNSVLVKTGNGSDIIDFDNNTFVNSVFYGEFAYAFKIDSENNFEITNSIFWATGKPINVIGSSSNLTIRNSIIKDGLDGFVFEDPSYENTTTITTENLYQVDPIFNSVNDYDFSLSDYSPAIGTGSMEIELMEDFNGDSRPQPINSNPDIGAFENILGEPLKFPAPTNLDFVDNEYSILLSWDYELNNSIIDKYEIWKGIIADTLVLQENVSEKSSTINTIPDSTYYYSVRMISKDGRESSFSDTLLVKTLNIAPNIPSNVELTATNSQIDISWLGSSEPDLMQYNIYRKVAEEEFAKFDSVSVPLQSYIDSNISVNTNYSYRLTAVDSLQNESDYSETVRAVTNNLPPIAREFANIRKDNINTSTFALELNSEGSIDQDGTIDTTFWYVNGELKSLTNNFSLEVPQGTSIIELVVTDNHGARDSSSFKISINAGYRSFTNENAGGAGVSLLGNDYFFIPLSGGTMQILDSDFSDRFDIAVGGEIRSVSSISPDTTLYLASSDRVVYSFDHRGIPLWDTPLGGELQATPTIDSQRNLIYVGVSNSNLFALNNSSGNVVWSYRLENPITQPGVIVAGRYLLVVTEEGEASYFDLDGNIVNQELSPIGTVDINDQVVAAPAVDNESFIYVTTDTGKLIKIEFQEDLPNFGQMIWETQATTSFKTSPVIGYDGTIYVGGDNSIFYAFDSSNGSLKWQFQTQAAVTTTATINEFGIIYLGDETGRIYAIDEFGNQIWYYDAGKQIGNASAYEDGKFIFATQDGELYKIYDGWRFASQAKLIAKGKSINKAPQWGTYQGNFRRSGNQSEPTFVSNEIEGIPTDYTLSQNYPNPFNPATQISYSLPEATVVRLDIINTIGQRIATLVDERKAAGNYTVNFDASSLSSGVYFYTIQAGDFVQTRKMLLIK